MKYDILMLRCRPQHEQQAINILRCFAGGRHDRENGRFQVQTRGGSRITISSIARMIAIAIALAFDIKSVGSPYLSKDELDIIYELANRQNSDQLAVLQIDSDFVDSLNAAALAFKTIGIQFPT